MDRKSHHLLVQISYASLAQYISVGLLVVRGFLLAHLLGPALFGTWTAMRLVLQFTMFGHMGARTGMLRDATMTAGAGDNSEASRLREAAGAVNLIGALVVSAATIVAVLIAHDFHFGEAKYWLCLAALVVIRSHWIFTLTNLQSRHIYALRSTLSILVAAMSTSLGIVAAYQYGLGGFLLALGISYCVGIAISQTKVPWVPTLRVDLRRSVSLVRSGFPIMLSNLAKMLLWTMDKLFIWMFMGNAALGIYAVQSTVTNFMMLLPGGMTEVLYPQILARLGQKDAATKARAFLNDGSDMLMRVMVPILAIAFLTLHLPIRWLLPDYIDAIQPGLIMILAAFFPVAGRVPGMILTALGGQVAMLIRTTMAIIFAAFALGTAILLDGGLVGVAIGMAIGLFCRFLLVTISAMSFAKAEQQDRRSFLGHAIKNFSLLVFVVSVVTLAIPDSSDSALQDCLWTALRCAIALLAMLPWCLKAWREYYPKFQDQSRNPTSEETDVKRV
jgi:O-antigen/teichoic acid export membrane protein